MHALAHNIATSDYPYDLILVQELWWNGSITTSFQGWQVILPSPMIKEHDCPRVIAYYRLQAGIEITLRMDISTNLDFMIINVNLYNQVEPGNTQDPCYTTDRLANI